MDGVRHDPMVQLGSPEGDDAIAKADYLVAVKLGATGDPVVVRVLVSGLEALPTTDLTGKKSIPAGPEPVTLLPGDRQLLQIVHSDATVQFCSNVNGQWVWLRPVFTAVST